MPGSASPWPAGSSSTRKGKTSSAMPRVIAQNRIPRVNLANRQIAVNIASGIAPAAQGEIGSTSFFLPGSAPANYQSALTVANPPLNSQSYAALLAYQGGLTGKTQQTSTTLCSGTNSVS